MEVARDIIRSSEADQSTRAIMLVVFDELWIDAPQRHEAAVILAECIVSAVAVGYRSPARIAQYAHEKLWATLEATLPTARLRAGLHAA